MQFKFLSIFLLIPNMVIAKDGLYSRIAENVPKLGLEQTIYLGDEMMQQRFGYNIQCLTPKQDLLFSKKFDERECLKSSQRFHIRPSSAGIATETAAALADAFRVSRLLRRRVTCGRERNALHFSCR